MENASLAPRLARLPSVIVLGFEVREAAGRRSRLLGLALLDPEEAGAGLLIPRCASVHTFGMRFPLDVLFLDGNGAVIAARHRVAPRRVLFGAGARAVLELPSAASSLEEPELAGAVLNAVGEGCQAAEADVKGRCEPQ